nr:hypothetical protein [Cressdnaviricota sp.]
MFKWVQSCIGPKGVIFYWWYGLERRIKRTKYISGFWKIHCISLSFYNPLEHKKV